MAALVAPAGATESDVKVLTSTIRSLPGHVAQVCAALMPPQGHAADTVSWVAHSNTIHRLCR
jgi:hypothetical protein